MNPMNVASNRTARLAREASTPVWTSQTGDLPRMRRQVKPVHPHDLGEECEDC